MAAILATFGGMMLLAHLIFGEVALVSVGAWRLPAGAPLVALLGVALLGGAWFLRSATSRSLRPTGLSLILLAAGISVSGIATTHPAWFEDQSPLFEFVGAAFATGVLVVIAPGLFRVHPNVGWGWWGIFVSAVLTGLWSQTGACDFKLLFGDDHASFLYRLQQLRESFPAIPFYNPLWNGGVEAREFFPSGVLNLFLLFLPVWYGVEPAKAYSAVVAALLFVLHPAGHYYAARALGLSRGAQFFAALGALTTSTAYYKWGLGFGTMGFITSISLAPLAAALWWRAVTIEKWRGSWLWVCVTALFSLFVLLWPLGAVILLPTGVVVCAHLLCKRDRGWWRAPTLILLLYLPYAVTLLSTSPVSGLLTADLSASSGEQSTTVSASDVSSSEDPTAVIESTNGLAHDQARIGSGFDPIAALNEAFRAMHPLYLCAFLPGLLILRGSARLIFGGTIAWLFLVALVGPFFKPQLELERMLVAAAVFTILPGAAALGGWLKDPDISAQVRRAMVITVAALAVLTPHLLWRISTGAKAIPVQHVSPLVSELVDAIAIHGGTGRVLFAGFTLHELDGGHVAPLAHWSGRPLIASRYQHDRWRYTDIIPERYRRRKFEGVEEYLNHYNVSAVITHDRGWRKWFRKHSQHYREVWNRGRFRIFQRMDVAPGYFFRGGGAVLSQGGDQIRVRVDTPEVVLRFNYLPFLEANACKIGPLRVDPEMEFIELRECIPGSEVTIRASSIGKRLWRLLR